ncbi:MAG: hypothetical protein CVV64_20250 [Candidatus Wallbacteria bacterium HGW-Wallbacteria-1]|jgi:DNA-binding response OmpR family regulator|uniref:DNA-binding response regulator n=1 Tax=Candidatus Wallbacteria bacterium HGW-Wallbacteria-1 TaxID=2013854 RepID=A0A2N1PID4_9BACT|nr:MAG: hypothetical protein CVV64_20250 [Candidatus Wallbacteria bacterium HGW-Wallbacteria-1]
MNDSLHCIQLTCRVWFKTCPAAGFALFSDLPINIINHKGSDKVETRNKRICVVDDDPKLVELIVKYMSRNGYPETFTLEPSEILAGKMNFDLFILDVMMPGIDGFELCKGIRAKSDAFIIFLTARSESFDRIVGLELGADDYVSKPFEARELLARINSLFRRQEVEAKKLAPEDVDTVEYRELILDRKRQLIIRAEQERELTTYEFRLLEYFCSNPNSVLSREQITAYLESHDFTGFGRSVDIGISRLRKKLDFGTGDELLRTVWGRGYILEVTRI